MHSLSFFSCLLAIASAGNLVGPAGYAAPAYIRPHIGHAGFHTQDTAGQYNYGFNSADGIHRSEVRGVDGSVAGSYSYISPEGAKIHIDYSGGALGFNAAGTGIPVPVSDTPEVAAAKSAHYAHHVESAARAAVDPHGLGYAGLGYAGYAGPAPFVKYH
uniref:Cuticle protein 6 n=1 Tax=Strigamia maritima TaxID=126957 RepID=T1IQE7_STRMM